MKSDTTTSNKATSSTPINGGAAFPGFYYTEGYGCMKKSASGEWETYSPGMTLCDWFAGQALAGMLSCTDQGTMKTHADFADQAWRFADAMIAARKQTNL
jgi:hypothetical protein